uniref:Uncharacterized protein n=1 Tax=Oryza rufipogon TaxID=4529 RepID=A0A0E0REP6_ORYRU
MCGTYLSWTQKRNCGTHVSLLSPLPQVPSPSSPLPLSLPQRRAVETSASGGGVGVAWRPTSCGRHYSGDGGGGARVELHRGEDGGDQSGGGGRHTQRGTASSAVPCSTCRPPPTRSSTPSRHGYACYHPSVVQDVLHFFQQPRPRRLWRDHLIPHAPECDSVGGEERFDDAGDDASSFSWRPRECGGDDGDFLEIQLVRLVPVVLEDRVGEVEVLKVVEVDEELVRVLCENRELQFEKVYFDSLNYSPMLVAAFSVGMALRCRSHVVGAELFAHGEVAPRRLEDKREREMTPVVLTSTAMVMAEAVASEKLGGVGFRRRRQTPAAGAVGSCIEEEAPLDVGWRPVVSRAAADLTGRVSETMTAGSRTPCAAASGPKWFSAAARLNDEACSSGAWWSGRKRCGAAGGRRRAWAEKEEHGERGGRKKRKRKGKKEREEGRGRRGEEG